MAFANKPTPGEVESLPFRDHPRYRGCIGHWIMNEGGGLIARDISGLNNNGTLSSTTTWTAGQFGPALDVLNATAVLDAGPYNLIENVPEFSISMWMKSSTGTSVGEDLAAKFGTGADTVQLLWQSNETMAFLVQGTDAANYTALFASAATNTHWNHVVGTKRAGSVHVYMNGVEGGTSPSMTVNSRTSSHNLFIGARNATTSPFVGFIDECRIYNRGLSAAEIISLRDYPFLEFDEARIALRRRQFKAPAVIGGPRRFMIISSLAISPIAWVINRRMQLMGKGPKGNPDA